MRETLKLYKSIITEKTIKKDLEELIKVYQQTNSSIVFATVFVRLSNLVYAVSSKYKINENDLASIAAVTLNEVLLKFDFRPSCKFSSLYATILNYRLATEAIRHSYTKRQFLSKEVLTDFKTFQIAKQADLDDLMDTCNYALTCCFSNLTDREALFVRLKLEKYNSIEIGKILDVSQMTLTNIRKSLRKKYTP